MTTTPPRRGRIIEAAFVAAAALLLIILLLALPTLAAKLPAGATLDEEALITRVNTIASGTEVDLAIEQVKCKEVKKLELIVSKLPIPDPSIEIPCIEVKPTIKNTAALSQLSTGDFLTLQPIGGAGALLGFVLWLLLFFVWLCAMLVYWKLHLVQKRLDAADTADNTRGNEQE